MRTPAEKLAPTSLREQVEPRYGAERDEGNNEHRREKCGIPEFQRPTTV